MNPKINSVLTLNYYKDFACIGGVCEDNCCIGWDVDIDLKTFHKYQKVTDPELKALYKSKIKPYPYYFSEEVDYARVKLGKNKRCPFLNDKGLCVTQAKLGETYLSNVCATYPRMTNQIDGVLENTLTLSCPVAAKLVLLNPEGLSLVSTDVLPKRKIINMTIDTTAPQYKKHPVRHFQALRALSISLLTDRAYPVWERLYHLGEVFESLSEAHAKKRVADFPKLLSTFEQVHQKRAWSQKPFCLPEEAAAAQLHRINDLIERLNVFTEIDSARFVAYTKDYQNSVGTGGNPKNKKGKPELFLSLHQSYIDHFEAEYGYVLENYLVNFVYKNLFPFTESENLFEAYTMLALRFVMIRTYLVALQVKTPEEATAFIQVFAKAIEHHKSFSEDTLTLLRKGQLSHMSYLESLLMAPNCATY
jgi:lysine-N-methylase